MIQQTTSSAGRGWLLPDHGKVQALRRVLVHWWRTSPVPPVRIVPDGVAVDVEVELGWGGGDAFQSADVTPPGPA